MDWRLLQALPYRLIHEETLDNKLLQVKETEHYRWFEFADTNPQSMMLKAQPEKIVTPVYQALLLFLLFKPSHLQVLNLGLGGGSIERFLASQQGMTLTAVDSSQTVIDIAKQHFGLPQALHLFCQPAQRFINQINHQYDVIICDLFEGKYNPLCLLEASFYQQLARLSKTDSVLMLNLRPRDEQELLQLLVKVRRSFSFLILFEFTNYANVVVMASQQALPDKCYLQQQLTHFPELTSSEVEESLQKMHIVPDENNKERKL